MIVIGIDPGMTGGYAVNAKGDILDIGRLPIVDGEPNALLLRDLSENYPEAVVAIEVQQARPKQGRSSILKTGKGWGLLIGFFGGRGHPVVHVRSQEWKPTFRLTRKPKEASRAMAIDLWPDLASAAFRYKRDEGVAEAALIAEHVWRRRNEMGN